MTIEGTQMNGNGFKQYLADKEWLFDILSYDFRHCGELCSFIGGRNRDVTKLDGFHYILVAVLPQIMIITAWSRFLPKKYLAFNIHLILISFGFIIVSVIYRIGLSSVRDFIPQQTCYEKFVFWVIPEIILSILMLFIFICVLYADVNYTLYKLKKIFWLCCKMYCLGLFSIFLVLTMILVEILILLLTRNLNWTNFLLYIIFSARFYTIFFIYNFGSAVIIAATWHIHGKKSPFKTFLQATVLVIKYHIGNIAFHTTVFLPIISTRHEILNLRTLFDSNDNNMMTDSTFKSKEKKEEEKHYMVDVFINNLIFTVVYGKNCRDSIKTILTRKFKGEKLPSLDKFPLGWSTIYVVLCFLNDQSLVALQIYGVHEYNLPYFSLTSTVAYSKIAAVMFLLGAMLCCNYELTMNLRRTEKQENIRIKRKEEEKQEEKESKLLIISSLEETIKT